jgi:subtilisin family serine protease
LKRIILFGIQSLCPLFVFCQTLNWHHLDLNHNSVFGASINKAYEQILLSKTSSTVTVAVIDNGIDTSHEDLKPLLYNTKEKLNKKDDDRNGYVDDLYGWNFIGGKSGNVQYDNLELTRLIRQNQNFYDSLGFTELQPQYRTGFLAYKKMREEYEKKIQDAEMTLHNIDKITEILNKIVKQLGKQDLSLADFENYKPNDGFEKKVQSIIISWFEIKPSFAEIKKMLEAIYQKSKSDVEYHFNLDYDPRNIVGDDYNNTRQRFYGNNNVYGNNPDHGTHVAGIIGAMRNNGIGIDGIADNVKIISLRVVPDGDERDKDVANAIRYAVDNGAKVINMSFGKPLSSDKSIVDDAVKYAMQKDVLIIHAAGNDGKDLDDSLNSFFPNKFYANNTGVAKAWINVGASGFKDDSTLVAPFSNYGKTKVDVFAPGVHIYSTMPGSKYDFMDGTSMAAPVVTGIAALIREYYPKLTAAQVKEIIIKSVVKRDLLKDKCSSGGVVNAYNALKLAEIFK